jgi:hypothetical protein
VPCARKVCRDASCGEIGVDLGADDGSGVDARQPRGNLEIIGLPPGIQKATIMVSGERSFCA